jgi:hypothetical protein
MAAVQRGFRGRFHQRVSPRSQTRGLFEPAPAGSREKGRNMTGAYENQRQEIDLVPRLAWSMGPGQRLLENTELLEQLAQLRAMYDNLFCQLQDSEERVLQLSEERRVLNERLAAPDARAPKDSS